jgi:anaphase-promoting complex subunit 3
MTLLAKRDYGESLKYFERAEQLDPTNGLNRYQKANALVRLERYNDALHEL